MKHLKNFESITKNDISPNNILVYKNRRGYTAIGKTDKHNNKYKMYDYFDNTENGKGFELLNDINYTLFYDEYSTFDESDFYLFRNATTDEIERYNMAIQSNKYNI